MLQCRYLRQEIMEYSSFLRKTLFGAVAFAWAAPVGLILNNVIWIGFLCGGERWFLVLVYFLGLMRRLMDFDKWSSISFPIT